MGVLTDLFEEVTLTDIQQAIIDATCLAILADGKITRDEEQYAVASIAALLECEATQAATLAQQSFARIEGDHDGVLAQLADRAQGSQEVEAVFMAAAYVAFQGGGLYLDEEAFLIKLAGVLNLAEDETDYLIDVAHERLSGDVD